MWKVTVENDHCRIVAGDATGKQMELYLRNAESMSYFHRPETNQILVSVAKLVFIFSNGLDDVSRIIQPKAMERNVPDVDLSIHLQDPEYDTIQNEGQENDEKARD